MGSPRRLQAAEGLFQFNVVRVDPGPAGVAPRAPRRSPPRVLLPSLPQWYFTGMKAFNMQRTIGARIVLTPSRPASPLPAHPADQPAFSIS